MNNTFVEQKPTAGVDFQVKNQTYNRKLIKVHVWDAGGDGK